jgi:hypothetical protein
MKRWMGCLILFLTCCRLFASSLKLVGDSPTVDARLGEKRVEVVFPFANAGEKPVKVVAVVPTCSCTVAKLERLDYAPGAEGELHATVDIEGYASARKNVDIILKTDEEGSEGIVLRATILIPELVTWDKRALIWDKGSPVESQAIRLTLHPEAEVRSINVVSSDKAFAAKMLKFSETEWLLVVSPASGREEVASSVMLSIESKDQLRRDLLFYLFVR